MMRRILSLVVLTSLGAAPAAAQRNWNAPFPAHHVIDNIYFVGTEQLGTFLVTTPAGHILINSDFESTVPSIRESSSGWGSSSPTSRSSSAATPTATTWRPTRS